MPSDVRATTPSRSWSRLKATLKLSCTALADTFAYSRTLLLSVVMRGGFAGQRGGVWPPQSYLIRGKGGRQQNLI